MSFGNLRAQEFNTRGFIALDIFSIEKEERQKSEQIIGIGTLDLRMYASKDDLSSKIKIDLDGDISTRNRIFEEALVYYRLSPNWNITFGKGKVPFHQMHWGVIINSYVDGGSVLGTQSSIRDFDRKILLTLRYGRFSRGFFNHFTIFGNPDTVRRDGSTGRPCFDSSCQASSGDSYVLDSGRAFSLEHQRGFSNKFEYFYTRNLQFNFSTLWYKNDVDPHDNYGVGLSLRYRTNELEIWSELTHGQYSKSEFLRFGVKKQLEQWFQIGIEQRFTENNSWLLNLETQFINKEDYQKNGSPSPSEKYSTTKIEFGLKHYLSRSAFLTTGGILEKQFFHVKSSERQRYEDNEGEKYRQQKFGAGFKTTLAYWF